MLKKRKERKKYDLDLEQVGLSWSFLKNTD